MTKLKPPSLTKEQADLHKASIDYRDRYEEMMADNTNPMVPTFNAWETARQDLCEVARAYADSVDSLPPSQGSQPFPTTSEELQAALGIELDSESVCFLLLRNAEGIMVPHLAAGWQKCKECQGQAECFHSNMGPRCTSCLLNEAKK